MRKDLAQPALALTPYDVADAETFTTNIFGVGQTGSGKTTLLLSTLLASALRLGAGLLCCCFKVGAADEIIALAKRNGRAESVLRWNGRNYRFNPLQYFLSRYGVEAIGSVVQILVNILDIIRTSGPTPGRVGDEFWQATTWNKLANSIPILFEATKTVRIGDLLAFTRSAPQTEEQLNDAAWRSSSVFFQMMEAAAATLDPTVLQRCLDYWQDYVRLDGRTKSNIHMSLVTGLSKLNQGILHDAFCTETSFVPELCVLGVTIVMDTPPALYGDDGILLQKVFKYCFQEAMLLRPALNEQLQRRLCVVVADECQEFLVPRDAFWLATCRSSRTGCIYLTQSLPTLISRIAGEHPEDRVYDLLSHFNTKIFLTLGCQVTAKWASELCGRSIQWRESVNEGRGSSANSGRSMGEGTNWGVNSSTGGGSSSSSNGGSSSNSSWSSGSSSGGSDQWNRSYGEGTSHNSGWSTSQTIDMAVEPAFFAQGLKTGRDGVVSALWLQSGRHFRASGTNYVLVEVRR